MTGAQAPISWKSWPSAMFIQSRQGIAARASPGAQRGLPIGLSMSTRPSRTAIPSRAWVIDLAIDQEMSRLSGP